MVLVAPDLIEDNSYGESSSRWVLLTESAETFSNSKIRDTLVGWSSPRERSITWTDDFSSLWRIVK
jgi:hypothetical protein